LSVGSTGTFAPLENSLLRGYHDDHLEDHRWARKGRGRFVPIPLKRDNARFAGTRPFKILDGVLKLQDHGLGAPLDNEVLQDAGHEELDTDSRRISAMRRDEPALVPPKKSRRIALNFLATGTWSDFPERTQVVFHKHLRTLRDVANASRFPSGIRQKKRDWSQYSASRAGR
jgi:hypothetical protein